MRYTHWTWVACGLALLGVEAAALVRGDPPLTAAMRSGADRWLLWPAAFGTLCGHFFGASSLPGWAAWALVPLGAAVAYRDLAIGSPVAPVNHLAVCLLFMGLGAFLWGAR